VIEPLLLTLALAMGFADDEADAVMLIARLSAPSFDDRVAAFKALERLGPLALPALRAAADSNDPRVRSRVRALIDSVGRNLETERFARPTLIRLDFRNRPLGEVVTALNGRHDLGLVLRLGPEPRRGMMVFDPDGPRRLKELRDREITLEVAQPLPFWAAIDQLCSAGALHYAVLPGGEFGTGASAFGLLANRAVRGPVSDSGPFRVEIAGVHAVFDRDFTLDPERAPRPPKPPGAGDLTVRLAVSAEPGLMLHQSGSLIVTDAIDDRDRPLSPKGAVEQGAIPLNGYHRVMNGFGPIQVNAELVAPDPPGSAIRRLKGKLPVIAVAKGSDPIVVRLTADGDIGKPFSNRAFTLIVDGASVAPGAQIAVNVTVRTHPVYQTPIAKPYPSGPDLAAFDRDRVLEHLELFNAAGRRLGHGLGQGSNGFDSQGFFNRYRLVVAPDRDDGPAPGPGPLNAQVPTELRYYPYIQKATEIPFDFRDIPMP
jgi:hypothetical protein